MEEKQIKAMENWPKPTLIYDVQVFINFANFYWCFIQSFSRIVVLLISFLKMTGLLDLALKAFKADGNEVVKVGGKANKIIKDLSKSKKSKNKKSKILTYSLDIRATGKPMFLTFNAKKAFNHLKQAFIKALILQHFDPECHI